MSWKDALQRRDEVKAAFVEAYVEAMFHDRHETTPDKDDAIRMAFDAWERSDARKRLEKPLD